jgi:SAM-dependent methyltransferase
MVSAARELASRAKHRLFPRRDLPFPHCVEEPAITDQAGSHSVLVKGWMVAPRGAAEIDFAVEHGGRTPLATVERPDVAERRRSDRVVGFQGLVAVADSEPGVPWQLLVSVDRDTFLRPLPVTIDAAGAAAFETSKAAKLDRLEPHLRCPRPRVDTLDRGSCLGELSRRGDTLACDRCGATYPRRRHHFDFLSSELRTVGNVVSTSAISDWGYDPIATSVIDAYPDGLVLDAGSGLKARTRPNVINLEIADYPTTDVLAIGEHLPFASESLDAVLSLAVLEHVRDPFRCAAEIARVVRPGGRIYVAVPFLQPYHGYPHHYYNMTRQGLEQLFVDDFVIEEAGTPTYGLPVFTLTWFLRSYLKGLPRDTARRLGSMRIRDLVDDGDDYLAEPFVGQLSPDVEEELACANFVLATKR